MDFSRTSASGPLEQPSILLASDSERQGTILHRILADYGFQVSYVGHYSSLDHQLQSGRFDVVLLEVSGEHAVEAAVEAALRIKRARSSQFVGYIADSALEASGLAGDGIFPRASGKLPEALSSFFSQHL